MADLVHDLFSLEGQTAVVIGGTGVLCGRMAETLARAGAAVVVAGRNRSRGEERVQAITQAGGRAAFLPVEVTRRDAIANLAAEAERLFGPVDILINGAGVNSALPYFAIDDASWEQVIATNLQSVHYSCQIFGKGMVERGRGSILNVASIASLVPLSRVFAYSASKAAVVNYSQNLAREFAPHGVRVNCLSPGFIPAEQNRKILDAERVQKILARTPMGRFGEPEDLDGALLFLTSARAGAFVTGINLLVDGGFAAMAI